SRADEISDRRQPVSACLCDANALRGVVDPRRGAPFERTGRCPGVARYSVLIDDAVVLENRLRTTRHQRCGAKHGVARHELTLLEAGVVDTDGVIDEKIRQRRPCQLRRSDEALNRLWISNTV